VEIGMGVVGTVGRVDGYKYLSPCTFQYGLCRGVNGGLKLQDWTLRNWTVTEDFSLYKFIGCDYCMQFVACNKLRM